MPRSLLHALLLVFGLASAADAQSKATRLDEYVAARAKLGQFNGSVLVAREGRILLDKGYGLANVEHRVKAGPETRYALASLTKSFTDAAIFRLQEDGKLSTVDSLCSWIADCPAAWRPVTLTQMMHHTSGIPDYETPLDLGSAAYIDFMSQSHSAARIIAEARTKPLDFSPGTKFSYSNTAYVLLGAVIEKASGTSFQNFLREHVLKPSRLTGMFFTSDTEVVPHLASGYHLIEADFATVQGGMRLDEHTLLKDAALPLDGPHGDADLIGTAHDLWAWTQAIVDSIAISGPSVREMLTPGLERYGTGWFIDQRFGKRTASHTGLLPGYASVVEWYPDSRTAIILITNTTGVRLSVTLRDLAAIVFDKPYDVPVARHLTAFDSTAARPLAGEYSLTDGTTAIVTLDKEMLLVQIPGRFTAGAFPVSANEYYAPFFDNTVRFVRDPNGAGRRIALRINGETLSGTRK